MIKFEIWDTAGQERFASLAPMYYRNAQSALVVYDITKPTSFIKARHWVNELKAQASPGIVIALVGNKLDLVSDAKKTSSDAAGEDGAEDDDEDDDEDTGSVRKVAKEEGQQLADSEGLLFFETSAKSGLNVRDVFLSIANKIPEDAASKRGGAGGAAGGAGGNSAAGGREGGAGGRVDLTAGSGAHEGSQTCQC